MKRVYSFIIFSILCMLVFVLKPAKIYASDTFFTDRATYIKAIENSLEKQNVEDTYSYGCYTTYEEANNDIAVLRKEVANNCDLPYWFAVNGCYVGYSIYYYSDNTYSITAKVYRYFDINEIDWDSIIKSLNLNGKTDMEKIIIVHEWVRDYFSYDCSRGYTLKESYTLKKGKCDTYSYFFCRLLMLSGVDCRCMDGVLTGTKDGHVWNVVRLGSKWYFIDTSSNDRCGDFTYFMRGKKSCLKSPMYDYMYGDYMISGLNEFHEYALAENDYFKYMLSADDDKIILKEYLKLSKKKGSVKSVAVTGNKNTVRKDKKKGYIVKFKKKGVCFGTVSINKKKKQFLIYNL